MALPEHVTDIIDPLMFFEEDEDDANDRKNEDDIEERSIIKENDPRVNVSSTMIDCLVSVFRIGLSCSTTSPNERMCTNVVINEMNAIKDTVLKFKKEKRRKLGMLQVCSCCCKKELQG